jgi:enoyl-CoA hydratase/carnithine racemase
MTNIDLAWEADARIARIGLNRAGKLNALNRAMLDDLAEMISSIQRTPSRRAVIVASTCERAFSVGADLYEWNAYDGIAAYRACLHGQTVFDALARLDVPTIAVIDGLALGGGLELALACDLRIASDRSGLGFPEAKLAGGIGWGGLSRLVSLVGPARAKELVFTGRTVEATEARDLGLLTAVHPPEALASTVDALIAQILANGPIALHVAKQIIDALSASTTPALLEAFSGALFAETADAREGKAAFMERRPPVYRNA